MNLLSVTDLTPSQLADLVDTALRVKKDPDAVRGALAGRSIGLFFMKQSVRTWVSCDVAAMQLGIHTVVIRNDQAGMGSRESPEDVGRVLERYLDLLGMRVFDHQDLVTIAGSVAVPVVNLLSDREHPCQAVADLVTVAERRPLPETELAYVGDGNNVCHSLLLAAAMSGCRVRVGSPAGFQPDPQVVETARRFGEVLVTDDPVEAASGADVVYTDVWTSMGQEAEAEVRRRELGPYQVDLRLFSRAAPDAVFMHCLPAHRGEEVTSEVIEHPRSVVFDQAENRLHSFKAILLQLLG
jgi:ornithine carbamoyltransferase